MSVPNEFVSPTHSFHHENVTPLVIQTAHSNSNFPATANTNNVSHFNGSNFFPNSLGYDVSMLPLFHHASQRPVHFNTPFVPQHKHSQSEIPSKEELSQLSSSVNRHTTSFNSEVGSVSAVTAQQTAYWSRQSQIGPYGVLPHEISSDHVSEEKSQFENALNAHYVAQSLSNLNQLPVSECDKKSQVIIPGRMKDPVLAKKQLYVPKSANEMKIFNQEDMNFRNGVINHGGHAAPKLDQNKLINANYKKPGNDLSVTESVNTVPRDYRVCKSNNFFPNSVAPAVKYTGKSSKQYMQKVMSPKNNQSNSALTMMKNQRTNSNSSPLMPQKISEFHEDGQSSPISLTSDDMSEQHRYSSPSHIKDNDATMYHNMNSLNNNNNNICHTSTGSMSPATTNFREHHVQDMHCHNGNKSKVTHQYSKLPYSVSNSSDNSRAVSEASQLNRKASFSPLYAMYNDPLNAIPQQLSQKRAEKSMERIEAQHQSAHAQALNNPVKMVAAPHTEANSNLLLPKQQPNGLVGYSSVIMRTDRNYEGENKIDKLSRQQVPWPVTESMKMDKMSYKNDSSSHAQASQHALSDQQQLLIGLTERQHSYFDTSPCPPQVTSPGIGSMKCNSKSIVKNVYGDGQHVEPAHHHHQVSQNVDQQLHNYQQYAPVKPPSVPLNNQSLEHLQTKSTEKTYRQRRSAKSLTHDFPNRDPPPAHANLYQQPVQNTSYVMDGGAVNRYDVSNQYYSPTNVNNYNVSNMNVAPEPQHHSVIASHTSPVAHRSSPNSNAPMRQLSQMPSSVLPLSTYFSPPQQNSSQYPSHEYPIAASSNPVQTYQLQNEISSPYCVDNSSNVEEDTNDGRDKVIVPDIEDEFKFLFDPQLRHYKEISCPAEEEALYKDKSSKTMFFRKNVDFLSSYLKFLENNCESVETLSDSSSSAIKTWNRNKVVYQPLNKDKEEMAPTSSASKEAVKIVEVESECNFENDPRYYPLPKSSDKRRLFDSSSEDESDEVAKKPKSEIGLKKLPVTDVAAKKPAVKKESKPSKKPLETKKLAETKKLVDAKKPGETKKPVEAKKESKKEQGETKKETKVVKSKIDKLEKTKQKIDKFSNKSSSAEKSKPKTDKAISEIKSVKQSVVPHKKKQSKDSKKETQNVVPRRKVSDRKAKDEVKIKLKSALDSEDELFSSSDSDPSWTPRDDDDDSTKRRNSRIRSIRLKIKPPRKLSDQRFEHDLQENLKLKKEVKDCSMELSKVSESTDSLTKMGKFYVLKSQSSVKHPSLWKQKGDKLQKFNRLDQNGKNLYSSTSVMMKLSNINLNKYQEVETFVVESRDDKVIVELCDVSDVPTDSKIKENFMKESLCYENQFAIYIQTLVSQALDSNFLCEIFRENDVYFLNNMKVIDDVTSTYLTDLTSIVKWGSSSIDTLVKTLPFVSMKNIRNDSTNNKTCASCNKTNAKQTAIFYGQPYQRETLQGCNSNSIPNNLDKTIHLCGSCAREIKLFNKIWHQKYHMFIDCAKYVSKKKSDDKNKCTTDILNELLADNVWLSKLFYEIRNVWLQIWTLVQKMKGS